MNSGRQTPKKVRRNSRQRQNPNRGITAEISLKLLLSWAIALGAIASLFRLLPYHLNQQAKLKELRIQVQETDVRVGKLREQLNHNFDPYRTQSLMEQYSTLTSPNQSRIYWLGEDSEQ
ncbi:MAG: hypothetical protein WBM44_02685 [Waterburya sp.]